MAKIKFKTGDAALTLKAFRDKTRADIFLSKLKLRDLKRQCIIRGMPFEEAAPGYVPQLQGWFIKNFHVEGRKELLSEYDEWAETRFAKLNLSLFGHEETPAELRMGTFNELNEETGKKKEKKIKGIVKEKKVAEKNGFGVRVGTAKAYVSYLVDKGKSLETIKERLPIRFPGKSEKSIDIWYKKFVKMKKESVKV